MIQRTIKTGLGALTPSAWQDIVAATDVAASFSSETSAGGRDIGSPRIIRAMLTTATQITSRARWQYDWAQCRRKSGDTVYELVANGLTSSTNGGKKALNTLEAGNTASMAYGLAVTGGIDLADHIGYSVRRVPADTVVLLHIFRDSNGATSFEFSAPNPIDGSCSSSGLLPDAAYDFGTYSAPTNSSDFGTYAAPTGQADFGEYDALAS